MKSVYMAIGSRKEKRIMSELDKFTQGYIECAFWSSMDGSDPNTGGDPLDQNYDYGDLDPEALAVMTADCVKFQEQNPNLLQAYSNYVRPFHEDAYAGHDFWLTRNRHGAGFWDRGAGFVGAVLTKRSEAFSECDLYVGDDGKVYLT